MQENEFYKIKYLTTPDKCTHPNIVRLYDLGAHSDYGCVCCGMTASSKDAFRNMPETQEISQVDKQLDTLINRYPSLASCKDDIRKAYDILEACYLSDHKLLIAGNGGSAADAEHIAGELMKRFKVSRTVPQDFAEELISIDPERGQNLAKNLERGLMAIPLVAHEALTTAYINDVDGLGVFAQQLYGFGRPGDVFLGISTSGNSKNVMSATVVARALGIKVIGLTGANGGELAKVSDVAIKVPETETYRIQELHLPVYHCLCLMLEERFFGA